MFFIKNDEGVYTIKFLGIKIRINSKKNYIKKAIMYSFVGKNNKLLIQNGKTTKPFVGKINGLNISIVGNNNTIIIDKKTLGSFSNSWIELSSSNSIIKIEETDSLKNLNIATCCGNNQRLTWGKGSTCNGVDIYLNDSKFHSTIEEIKLFQSK